MPYNIISKTEQPSRLGLAASLWHSHGQARVNVPDGKDIKDRRQKTEQPNSPLVFQEKGKGQSPAGDGVPLDWGFGV